MVIIIGVFIWWDVFLNKSWIPDQVWDDIDTKTNSRSSLHISVILSLGSAPLDAKGAEPREFYVYLDKFVL